MAEDESKQDEDKLEFTPEGEAPGYISLDQARLLVMQTARDAPGEYGHRYRDVPMAFEVAKTTEEEDSYSITLSFRPQGDFVGTPGEEQFFVNKVALFIRRQGVFIDRQGHEQIFI